MELNSIQKILKRNYVDSLHHTHTSLINPRGKFSLNRQSLEEFWDVYCQQLHDNPDAILGVTEAPQQYVPVMVDVDLRVRAEEVPDNTEELYTEEQLISVIGVYQSVLRQIVDNCTTNDLTCVVLQKDMYQQTRNETTYLKHGFHLHFPYCFLNRVDQEIQLIPRVKEQIKNLNLFASLNIEDSSTIIDKAPVKNNWLLYGSRKSEDAKPYLVTKVYDANLEEMDLEEAFRYYTIYDHKEKPIPIKGKVDYYLPRILSILPYGRPTKELKSNLISPLVEARKREKKSSIVRNNISVEEALSQAKKLLPLLSDYRSEDRNEWMSVGWILHNISEGSQEGLELWCDFSSRCEAEYDENRCIYEWDHMVKRENGLGLGSLRHYAKKDNPEEYKKLKAENSQKHITESLELSGSHYDVARALSSEYADEFVCASYDKKIWYQYIGHKWEEIEGAIPLREKLSVYLVARYRETRTAIYQELGNLDDENKAARIMLQEKAKRCEKIMANLKNNTYKNSVIKECMETFYDSKFLKMLDANPNIIGFRNGVYDLDNNIFRHGHPDDYISKCMPIDYINYTEDDNNVLEVHKFLEQIFPDKSLRKYFMDIMCDVFVGGNKEKIVLFWTGEGDNGKSIMQKLFELMLGPLAVKLNTTAITGKKPSAGAAFADLARTGGGVRWVVLEEPDNDESINSGVFKHLSGGDSFYARDLFETGKKSTEITPLFKLIFICNKLPHIKQADRAVWNRTRVLPFESVFRFDNVPETYEEQLKQKIFPRDKSFNTKLPSMAPAFAWILLEHRKKDRMIIEPDKVTEATKFYQKQNNIYQQFLDEELIDDEKGSINLTELYTIFKEWFKESFPGNSLPIKLSVEEYFVKLWGPPSAGKKWKGRRQRTQQDFMEKGDTMLIETDDEESDADSDLKKEDKKLPL